MNLKDQAGFRAQRAQGEKVGHTPGPWVDSPIEPGAIITLDETAIREWIADAKTLESYGGRVICESVASQDRPLIKAAPRLLQAAKALWAAVEREYGDHIPAGIRASWIEIEIAIAKAEGE